MSEKTSPVEGLAAVAESAGRYVSVDALRGFDMFWIVGAEGFVGALNEASGGRGFLQTIATQFDHAEWIGFRFYDLIFPLFVFLVGVATVFSLDKIIAKHGMKAAHIRIIKRFILLYLLGIFYYGGLGRIWPEIRLVGVLQRLALCYLFTSLLYCHLRVRELVAVFMVIMVGYWAALTFVAARVPGHFDPSTPAVASYEQGLNLTHYIDYHFLPGRRWDGDWDPEGILSTFPAVASCLLGVFAGLLIAKKDVSDQRKVFYFVGAGVLMLALGYLWGLEFPIIKKLWTSSYVLVAGGYSCLLLAFFYQVVDIWKFRAWVQPFIWIGSNALAIYMADNLIDFDKIASRFVGGNIELAIAPYGPLLLAATYVVLILLFARYLYRKQIFIRI